ncbi:Cytochrome c oxidase subunit 7A [Polyrhizophydium stewartii]|uniref:Cytochrome c oxidase subunit 7A n=1 Tax=Polyrhizophydium stewartii TaxID=2732419 RepID=A0ABR4N4P6_9FUNG
MPIAPITGRFRGRFMRDIVGSITFGVGIAYAWWFTVSRPKFETWRAHDAKVRAELIAEKEAWLKEQQ